MNPPSTDLRHNFQFTKMTVHSTALAFGLIYIINWDAFKTVSNTVTKPWETLLRLNGWSVSTEIFWSFIEICKEVGETENQFQIRIFLIY